MVDEQAAENTGPAGHELRDLNPNHIALFGAALAAIIIIVLLAAYALFHYFYLGESRARPRPSPLSFGTEPTPEPRLSVDPGAELSSMRAEEDEVLKNYGWIDRERGIVRIPIDRAMAILARKGLPVRSEKTDRRPSEKRRVEKGKESGKG
jgi:hypothetical protein